MNITHVLRGEEWLSSTPKHLLLYEAFGWVPPQFAHLPLLLNKDRSKLSKRDGTGLLVHNMRNEGLLPTAVNNFAALLGWAPSARAAGQELFLSLQELVQAFDLVDVNRAGAVVDLEKLSWFQRRHMRALTPSTAVAPATEVLERVERSTEIKAAADLLTHDHAKKVLLACSHTFDTLTDVVTGSAFLFSDEFLGEAALKSINEVWLYSPNPSMTKGRPK